MPPRLGRVATLFMAAGLLAGCPAAPAPTGPGQPGPAVTAPPVAFEPEGPDGPRPGKVMRETLDGSYFPVVAGTWKYLTRSAPKAGGLGFEGERTVRLVNLERDGDAVSASAFTTTKLKVPGYAALNATDARLELALTPTVHTAQDKDGGRVIVPLPLKPGAEWAEGATMAKAVAEEDVTLTRLGVTIRSLRIEATADGKPVSTAWRVRGVGLVRLQLAFEHEGSPWMADLELIDWPTP